MRQVSVRLSVIIPTFQRRELVLACVRALARQNLAEEFEIIVVVDGSTDASAEALRALRLDIPLTVIEQANRGQSAARNAGAAIARGELLLFLDDDMEADALLLAEHDREHRNRIALVLGHIPLHPDSPANFLSDGVGRWAKERRERLSQSDVSLQWQDWVMGQASVPRTLFADLGRFDDAFTREGTYGNEDLEFCYRVRKAGVPIIFNANAISWQRYVVAPRAHLRQWFESGSADVQFVRKHPELSEQVFPNGLDSRWFESITHASLRWLSLALIRSFSGNRFAQRLFFRVRALCYARGVAAAGGVPRQRPLQILCYHAIADLGGSGLKPYGVRPDHFRAQISALQRHGYHFISTAEFLRYLNDGAGLPKRPLLLTFDDCYQSLHDAGLPILTEFGIPALAFAVSGKIGATNEWDANLRAPALPLADATALKALESSSIAIAAHSCTHRNLRTLPGETLFGEVNRPLAELRACGLSPAPLFAFPYGEHDQRVRNAVQVAGFDAATTTESGIVNSRSNRFRLPRIEVMAGDSILELRFRLFRDRLRESVRMRFRRATPANPSVSVIVPAFNAERTLDATLASIRAQTLPIWEAVIIDDGSTDATQQIANSWCAKDSRFRLLERENGGEGAARNTGIAVALGEWLVFLDSDDWIAPEYIERMFERLGADRQLDGVVCGCARVTPAGVFTEEAVYGPLDLQDPFPKFVRNCPLAIHNCMIRRSVAVDLGGFDDTLQTCADWDFWQRAARKGACFGTISDVLALYRIRPGSSSTNASRVLADGFTVIRRGYSTDPRVPKAHPPEYSAGLQSRDLGETLFRHALWPASMQIANGQNVGSLLDALSGITAPGLDPKVVGEELYHNIPMAAGETPSIWPARFSSLRQRIEDLLNTLESASGAVGLAEAAGLHLERCILQAAEFDTQLTLGTSHGARIEITQSIDDIHADHGIRQFVLVVTQRKNLIGSIAIPADTMSLKRDAIAESVVTQLAWPIARNHLGLQVPSDPKLSTLIFALVQDPGTVSRFVKLVGNSYRLLKWQRTHGVIRNRIVARDLLRMLLELKPLSLGWRLLKAAPNERNALARSALASASRACVPKRFGALEFRS